MTTDNNVSPHIISIYWNYHLAQKKPDEYPEVLFETHNEEEASRVYAEIKLNPNLYYNVGVYLNSDFDKHRFLSQETMAKRRRTKMENKIRKQYGMFADELIERELKEKPDYYAATDIAKKNEELSAFFSKFNVRKEPKFTNVEDALRFLRVDLHGPFISREVNVFNEYRRRLKLKFKGEKVTLWEPWMEPYIHKPASREEKMKKYFHVFFLGKEESKETKELAKFADAPTKGEEGYQPSLF